MANTKHPGDFTARLTPDILGRVDEYRQELERRSPGLRVSMSSAFRSLVLLGLDVGKVA